MILPLRKRIMEKAKNPQFSQLLKNSDNAKILEAIGELREEGTDQVLEILAQLFIDNPDSEIRSAITQFFCDLKNQSSAETVIALINNKHLHKAKQMLVSSCWQTRLNYILYLETFIDLVMTEPFEIAFEAFTVVENIECRVSEGRKKELTDFISSKLDACRESNLVLADDLISIVEQYEE